MTKYVKCRVIDSTPSRPANPSTALIVQSKPLNPYPNKIPLLKCYQGKPDLPGDQGRELNMLV